MSSTSNTAPVEDFFGGSRRSSEAPLQDFFEDSAFSRPPRVEDALERHGRDGRPKIWLPDGSGKRYYSRPSSWGKVLEDTTNLSKWSTRVTVDGFVSFGKQSSTLRAEWAAVDPDDKDALDKLCEKGKGLREDADRVGTAVHAMTERHDLGLTVKPSDEHVADLEAWKWITRHFEIVKVECFVVNDEIQVGGTFDRLVKWKPCPRCGGRYYILDLKTGKIRFGQSAIGVQLGCYGNSVFYSPVIPPHMEVGAGGIAPGLREPLPEGTCRCRGIVVHLPAGSGLASLHWVDIERGWHLAHTLVAQIRAERRNGAWMEEFAPTADVLGLIELANSKEEINAIWAEHRREWTDEHTAAGAARLAQLSEVI